MSVRIEDLVVRNILPRANNSYDIGSSSNKFNDIYATYFRGSLKGNADTATKWASAKTYSLTGAVIGSTSFDGQGNLTIETTLSPCKVVDLISVAGAGWYPICYIPMSREYDARGTVEFYLRATGGDNYPTTVKVTADIAWNGLPSWISIEGSANYIAGARVRTNSDYIFVEVQFRTEHHEIERIWCLSSIGATLKNNYWNWYSGSLIPASNFTADIQISCTHYIGYSTSGYFTQRDGYICLDTGNYSNYALPLSGGTITGVFALKKNNVSSSIYSQNGSFLHYSTDASYGHWFNTTVRVKGDIYAGSNYSDLVLTSANISSSYFIRNYTTATAASSISNTITMAELPASAVSSGDPTYGVLLTSKINDGRGFQIAVGEVGNIRIRTIHSSGTNGYKDWKTMLDNTNYSNWAMPISYWNWTGQSGQPNWLWGGNEYGKFYVYNPSNFSVNYANSAGKLNSARTISLTGSVTGSVSFDGSGNVSIATTTNHNHDVAHPRHTYYDLASGSSVDINFGGDRTIALIGCQGTLGVAHSTFLFSGYGSGSTSRSRIIALDKVSQIVASVLENSTGIRITNSTGQTIQIGVLIIGTSGRPSFSTTTTTANHSGVNWLANGANQGTSAPNWSSMYGDVYFQIISS